MDRLSQLSLGGFAVRVLIVVGIVLGLMTALSLVAWLLATAR